MIPYLDLFFFWKASDKFSTGVKACQAMNSLVRSVCKEIEKHLVGIDGINAGQIIITHRNR
jgi:hypothetical protein